jgi:hypothetical protein
MNAKTDNAIFNHLKATFQKQFEVPVGCCEGDSAANDVEIDPALVEPALDDIAGWARHIHAKAGRTIKERSRGSFVEGNEYDGDDGREHADYMDDND